MTKLIKYFKPYWFIFIFVIFCIYIQVQADLALPGYMSKIISEGIMNRDQDFIVSTGIKMLLFALIGGFCTILASFLSSRIATGFARDLRDRVFTHIESFSHNEFNKFSLSSLIIRSTNDVQQIQTVLVTFLRIIIWAPILGFGAVQQAYRMAPSMSWIIALSVGVIVITMGTMFAFTTPKFRILQKLVDKLNLISRESLTGLRVIKAFNTETQELKKFNLVNIDLTKINIFISRIMVVLQPMMFLIFNLTVVATIWFGAQLISTYDLQIGEMMAFMQYSMQVIMAFLMMSMAFIIVPRASVSVDRIVEVLETDVVVMDPPSPKTLSQSPRGKIEFKNVSFSYEKAIKPVIENISFTANPGETTAFIGSTGSGKSTLINLIPRFFDVSSGSILIDNVDIREISQSALHNLIGYTSQRAVLFSGSIASNIKYGASKATDEEVIKYASIAQAAKFIEKLPHQYETNMAQGGLNFSGGQKQRISIARTIIKNAPIYIFDDTFSALDFETDAKLRKALAKETKEKTVLIVAQRVGTIMNADKIIVLDKGKIVGIGTHKELIEKSSIYKEIAQSQLSKEDLERSKK